jgi:hypothetical protein
MNPLFIRAEWDEDASVWVATSDDVPGLATEETTMEALIIKLKTMIPELLEANGNDNGHDFLKVFRSLPKKDRLAVVHFILNDKDVQRQIEIPNETTIESFSENKSVMPTFRSVDELRKDLLSRNAVSADPVGSNAMSKDV